VIRYSRGRDTHDNMPDQREVPDFEAFEQAILSDRGRVKGEVWFSGPFNSDGRRCATNAQPRGFLPVDLDHIEPERLPDLRLWFARYHGFGYPTASSTPEAPRERVVIELSRDANREECIRIGTVLAADLAEEFGDAVGVDSSVFRPEQPVFTPLHGAQAVFYDGEALDVDIVLAAAPEAPAKPKAAAPIKGRIAEGKRNATLTSLGGSMRHRGMTEGAIRAALLVENQRCAPPLPEGDVENIASSLAKYPAADEDPKTAPRVPPAPMDWAQLAAHRAPLRIWFDDQCLGPMPTLLPGVPGIGKTLLVQQWASCLALARPLLSPYVFERPLTVLMWACEEDKLELWRRQEAVCQWLGISIGELAGKFYLVARQGEENTLLEPVMGTLTRTSVYEELREQVNDLRADVMFLDNTAQTRADLWRQRKRQACRHRVHEHSGRFGSRPALLPGDARPSRQGHRVGVQR
jgi:hypothetical protein